MKPKKTDKSTETDTMIEETCIELQNLKRRRDGILKSKIKLINQLAANVAIILGYSSGLSEKERKDHWIKCKGIVSNLLKGKPLEVEGVSQDDLESIEFLIDGCGPSLTSFDIQDSVYKKAMEQKVKTLPVYDWFTSFRGLSALSLAIMVGETGDLSNYPNPAKVWKRMGSALFKSNGEVHVGQSWAIKKWHDKGLTKEQWEEFGYCPRRRSVMHLVASTIIMQCGGKNYEKGKENPFYQRYLEAKKVAEALHPDWTPIHLNKHALLCCGKRVLRELWIKWNPELAWVE